MLQNWKMLINAKKLSLGTKKGAFINSKAIFNYAMKMEYIRKNPFDKIDNFVDRSTVKKKMDYHTAEEFMIFINKAKEMAEERTKENGSFSEWNQ